MSQARRILDGQGVDMALTPIPLLLGLPVVLLAMCAPTFRRLSGLGWDLVSRT